MEAGSPERFMRLALRQAARALGDTAPNPVVGAVVVSRGRIVGQGYHQRAGLPHAEVVALRQAGSRARGSTLYVTLEPCHHTGRTPPCCQAILEAGVRRVVVAMKDPNPITNGRGLTRLRQAGIAVTVGVLEREAGALNAPFAKSISTRMPWVVAKVAQSLDGKIATSRGESQWISSAASRRLTHQLRRQADALLVGVNTVLRDDPLLTARDPSRPARADRPIKVILDSRLRTPLSSRCLSSASPAPTVIATTTHSRRKQQRYRRHGIDVQVYPPSKSGVPLRDVLRRLVERYEVMSVLIEGGGEVLASALAERVVDRILWCVAPMLIGGRRSPGSVGGEGVPKLTEAIRLDGLSVRRLDRDVIVEAAVVYPGRGAKRPGASNTRVRGAVTS